MHFDKQKTNIATHNRKYKTITVRADGDVQAVVGITAGCTPSIKNNNRCLSIRTRSFFCGENKKGKNRKQYQFSVWVVSSLHIYHVSSFLKGFIGVKSAFSIIEVSSYTTKYKNMSEVFQKEKF